MIPARYAYVLASATRAHEAAAVGELLHLATSTTPLLVFGGLKEMRDTGLMRAFKRQAGNDPPSCLAIAVLTPDCAAEDAVDGDTCHPSPLVTFLLTYMMRHLPATHVLAISQSADFPLSGDIHEISFNDQGWRARLSAALSDIGVGVDFTRVDGMCGPP